MPHTIGLAKDCSNSSADALELPQSYAKPMTYSTMMSYAMVPYGQEWFMEK